MHMYNVYNMYRSTHTIANSDLVVAVCRAIDVRVLKALFLWNVQANHTDV